MELQVFNNQEFGNIRTVDIDGKTYFSAKDIAVALGYSNPRKAVADHCKGVTKRDTLTPGGVQEVNFIPEGDVYRLIARSQLPSAEKFERWVFDEVIPQIRKTGGYHLPQTYSEALRELADKADQVERLEAENQKMLPKAEFFDAVASSKDAISVSETAKMLGTGQNRLFKSLRDKKILMRDNHPYQKYMDAGYFIMIEQKYDRPDGDVGIGFKTLVTQKGLDFIRRQM